MRKNILLSILTVLSVTSGMVYAAPLRIAVFGGGAMLGYVPSQVAAQIEDMTQKPMSEIYRGGIFGASTGSLVAALLTSPQAAPAEPGAAASERPLLAPKSATDIAQDYRKLGSQVFTPQLMMNVMMSKFQPANAPMLLAANQAPLEILLAAQFSHTMGASVAPLGILSANTATKDIKLFHSSADGDVKTYQAVLASCSVTDVFGPTKIGEEFFADAGSMGIGKPDVLKPVIDFVTEQLRTGKITDHEIFVDVFYTGFYASESSKASNITVKSVDGTPVIIHIKELAPTRIGYPDAGNMIATNLFAAGSTEEFFAILDKNVLSVTGHEIFGQMLEEILVAHG